MENVAVPCYEPHAGDGKVVDVGEQCVGRHVWCSALAGG